MNNNPWIEIKSFSDVPHAETLEWWDDYAEQVLTGQLRHYDGKHITIGMRGWSISCDPFDFSHYRLPEPESEYPQREIIKDSK